MAQRESMPLVFDPLPGKTFTCLRSAAEVYPDSEQHGWRPGTRSVRGIMGDRHATHQLAPAGGHPAVS